MDSLAEYVITVSGKKHEARLLKIIGERNALIELDGETIEVATRIPLAPGKRTSIRVNGRNHEVKVNENNRPRVFNIEVDGKRFVIELHVKPRRSSDSISKALAYPRYVPKSENLRAKKRGWVTSSMPGKIVLLKVKNGDRVEVGDPLCILEAMKMENEVIAPVGGVVMEVKIDQGSSVGKGDVLIVIAEP